MERLGADLEGLLAVIARSPIVVARRIRPFARPLALLPAGYGEVELAMLDWIAAEARRVRHSFTQM